MGGAPPWSYWWKGGIDEAAIYDRALAQSEIQAIYQAGTAGKRNPNCITPPTDIVAWWPGDNNGYDLARTNFGTLHNGATYDTAVVSQGFSFGGADDEITVSDDSALNFSTNGGFTIEVWLQPLENFTTYGVMDLIDKRQIVNSVTVQGWAFFLSDGQPALQLADAPVRSFNWANYVATGYDLRDGGWHHVAVSVNRTNSNGGTFYVDGVSVATFNPTLQPGYLSNNVPPLIGRHLEPGFNGSYMGIVDEFSIYRRALTGTEIAALYSAGEAGKCKTDTDSDGLTDLQEAFLGTSSSNADSDGDGVNDGTEFVQGRNPQQNGAVTDSGGQIQFQVFTPLR